MSPKVSPARFLDVALSAKGQLFHSYPHRELLWLIRGDVLSLIRRHPSFYLWAAPAYSPASPASGGDATVTSLLAATGILRLPSPIALTIVLNPQHPLFPPWVFVTSEPPSCFHPFLDPKSCAATTPYLLAWQHPKSRLPDLVDNFVNVFKFWPVNALMPLCSVSDKRSKPSPREAVDRLSMLLFSNLAVFHTADEEESGALKSIKSTLSTRAAALTEAARELEEEEVALKRKVEEVNGAASALSEWLSDERLKGFDGDGYLEAYATADDKSMLELETYASAKAIEDAMDAAEVALQGKAVGLAEYLREIRALAKEQFHLLKGIPVVWL